jgi:hypothetical protein
MNLTNHFDISRFWRLLKMELFRSTKGILMTLVIIFGLLLVGLFLEPLDDNKVLHTENYAFTLIVGGFILSSLAFNDLNSTLKMYHYLTLPVSTLEKFICMWLLTCVGWVILFTTVYVVYAWMLDVIGHLLFSHLTYEAFEPLGAFATKTMKVYFVLQGIFLVGATHFKGYAFAKTLFTLVLVATVCGTIIYFMMVDLFVADHQCSSDENGVNCDILNKMDVHPVWFVIQWLFWWTLAPLCWVITFFGLKEKEV